MTRNLSITAGALATSLVLGGAGAANAATYTFSQLNGAGSSTVSGELSVDVTEYADNAVSFTFYNATGTTAFAPMAFAATSARLVAAPAAAASNAKAEDSIKAEAAKAEAAKAEAASKAEAAKAEAAKAEAASKAEAAKAEALRAEAAKAEDSSKAEAAKAEADKAEAASKAEAERAEAAKAEAAKAEDSSRAEAAKAEAAKAEAARAEAVSKAEAEKAEAAKSEAAKAEGNGNTESASGKEDPNSSSITDIYLAGTDGLIEVPGKITGQSAGVSFSTGANPSNLPGGKTVGFDASAAASSNAPVKSNGVNSAKEYVTWTFALASGTTYKDILSALDAGKMRIGLLVPGASGGSASFLNNSGGGGSGFQVSAVPLPASLWLMFGALGGLGFITRRGRRANGTSTVSAISCAD